MLKRLRIVDELIDLKGKRREVRRRMNSRENDMNERGEK